MPSRSRSPTAATSIDANMFSWTLTEVATRFGNRTLADAYVAERLSWKPENPINRG